MKTILTVNNLSKKYGTVQAVNNLTFDFEEGSVLGILGPNGSGKTTTLSIITGLTKANGGTFKWLDFPENKPVNHLIGAVIEQPNFYPHLSVKDNLQIVAEIRGLKDYYDKIKNVLQQVDLIDSINQKFSALSLGMKARLGLAASLLGDPKILIFDEPTNGLDPKGIAFVRNLIKDEAKKGKSIILASHLLDEVQKVCTDVLILQKGKKIMQGKVNELLESEILLLIKSSDNKKLLDLIKGSGISYDLEIENDILKVKIKDENDTLKISELAMQSKIIITQLEQKKKSLEEEFLKILNNQ